MRLSPDSITHARRRLARIAAEGLPPSSAASAVTHLLAEAIPVGGYRLFGLDVASGLINRLLAASENDAWARHEWLRDIYLSSWPTDYHEYHRLARLDVQVAAFNPTLESCWGYPPAMLRTVSPSYHQRLYRELRSPEGGVLLARFPAAGQWVAAIQMYRRDAGWHFAEAEVALLGELTPVIGAVLQASLGRERATSTDTSGASSGVVVLSRELSIETTTATGTLLLESIADAGRTGTASLPTAIWAAVARLRDPDATDVASVHAPSPHGPVRVEAANANDGASIAVVLTLEHPTPAPRIPDGWSLTPQEERVARSLLRGMTNREIARALHVSENTVEWHLRHVYEKVGVRSRSQLIARFFRDAFGGFVDEGDL